MTPTSADVLFVGRDIAEAAVGLMPDVVVLDSLIDMDNITKQVAAALERHGVEAPNK